MTIEQDYQSIINTYTCRCGQTPTSCVSFFFDEGEQIDADKLCKEILDTREDVLFTFEIDVMSYVLKIDSFKNVLKRFCEIDCQCIADMYNKSTNKRIGVSLLSKQSYISALELLVKYPLSAAILIGRPSDEENFLQRVVQCDNKSTPMSFVHNVCEAAAAYHLVIVHCSRGYDGISLNYISFNGCTHY